MVNIWLDDARRPGYAPHKYKGLVQERLEWVWCKTVNEVKDAILAVGGIQNVDYMALDHDLGVCELCYATNAAPEEVLIKHDDKISYSSCIHNGDGTELINWMERNDIWPERPPTVHSFNPEGAYRMMAAIRRHYEQ